MKLMSVGRKDAAARPLLGILGICATALALSACTPLVEDRGWRPDDEAIAAIRPGVDNKESVARLLGSPSTVANFDDQHWYYVAATTETEAFKRDRVTDQQVWVINFDDGGTVTEVGHLGNDAGKVVAMNPDATATRGNELTIWQQLFGNLGRFNSPVGSGKGAPIPGGGTGPVPGGS